MNTRFLAQLAHRAVAGSDVKPRIAARFESLAPLAPAAEPVSDAAAPPERAPASPRAIEAIEPVARTPRPEPREAREAPTLPTRTITHTEIVERVREIERPVSLNLESRPAPPPALAERASNHPEPARAPLPPLLESAATLPPTPARGEIEPVTPRTRAAVTEAAAPAAVAAPARASTAAALLIPAAPAAVPAALSSRVDPAPTPAFAPIEIVIGRIEIRGDTAAAAPRAPVTAPRRTAMSLDAYLRGREEQGR